MITQKQVLDLFRYDPETGLLYWKVSNSPRVKIGDAAGYVSSGGYIKIKINSTPYGAHRIIWLMLYGELPSGEIDHINHKPSDNRQMNLRHVNHRENSMNRKLNKRNISGVNGVGWFKRTARWTARIIVKEKSHYLGSYKDWFNAVCAVKSAEKRFGFHENHGKVAV